MSGQIDHAEFKYKYICFKKFYNLHNYKNMQIMLKKCFAI